MKRDEAERLVVRINDILKGLPLPKAVFLPEFMDLRKRFHGTRWYAMIDEFQMRGRTVYGRARLVDCSKATWRAAGSV